MRSEAEIRFKNLLRRNKHTTAGTLPGDTLMELLRAAAVIPDQAILGLVSAGPMGRRYERSSCRSCRKPAEFGIHGILCRTRNFATAHVKTSRKGARSLTKMKGPLTNLHRKKGAEVSWPKKMISGMISGILGVSPTQPRHSKKVRFSPFWIFKPLEHRTGPLPALWAAFMKKKAKAQP